MRKFLKSFPKMQWFQTLPSTQDDKGDTQDDWVEDSLGMTGWCAQDDPKGEYA